MTLDEQILINQYGQDLISIEPLIQYFNNLDVASKRDYLENLIHMILQSKPKFEDGTVAIVLSGLKESFTPCVLLSKGVTSSNLQKIVLLPENELTKVAHLLLNLFKVGYRRRFELEKNDPNKWWYWDLSDEKKLLSINR